MRLNFTKILGVITALVICCMTSMPAEAGPQRAIIEDHTGAWCGWCPAGTEIIERLEEEHGEDVIAVAVHNGDAMAIPTYQGPLAQEMGVTGYPNGTINRQLFGNQKQAQHPLDDWTASTNQLIGQEATVDVEIDWNLNESTGELTATVTATVNEQINNQLGFNLWVIEDYVTGSGSQYDQQNYLSGRAGYEDFRFYDEPSVIQGFEHMGVLREALGGLWGENGSFPAMASPGEYTHEFSTNVSGYVQDIKNVYVAAIVHNKDNNELVNGVQDGRTLLAKAKLTTSTDDTQYNELSTSGDGESVITIKNENDFAVDADVMIDTENSLIPQGWEVSLDKSNVSLDAGQSVKVNVIYDSKGNAGFASVEVAVEPNSDEYQNVTTKANTYSLSPKTETALFFGLDNGVGPTVNSAARSSNFTNYGLIPISSDVRNNYPNLSTMIKTAIITVSDNSLGFSDSQRSANLNFIEDLMSNGTDILIVSPFDLFNYGGVINGTSSTSAANNFFSNTLGVEMGGTFQLVQNNQLYTIPIKGKSGDEIGNGIDFSLNSPYNQSYPYYAVYAGSMSIKSSSDAVGYISADHTQIDNLNEANSKVAVRVDNNGQRTAFMSISLDAIPQSERDQIVDKTLEWLQGESAGGPSISLSTNSHDFGVVKVEESDSFIFTIENEGTEGLEINSITFEDGSNFELGTSHPDMIIPKSTADIEVVFTPTENKQYSDKVIISTNDPNSPEKTINLSGSGAASSVQPEGAISDLFEMKIGPNPISESGTLTYKVTGNSAKNLSINLIDASGKVISNLYSGSAAYGENDIEINASELASGKYIIIANIDGIRTQLPLMISK